MNDFKICKCDGCGKTDGCKYFSNGWFCKDCSDKGKERPDIRELFQGLFGDTEEKK